MKSTFLFFLGSFLILWGTSRERDAAIEQRDAALKQADELAAKLKALELNPMGRVQSMPEQFGEGW